ncbi:hypothetical protein ACGFX2_20825 [Streptomyces goshikiensis]|uniref:hypothetical protein n=1 Tax=Streptomyces goshikiensis TaxID=1942 RepID=UPI003717DE1E
MNPHGKSAPGHGHHHTELPAPLDPAAPEGVLRRSDAFLLSAGAGFTGVRSAG